MKTFAIVLFCAAIVGCRTNESPRAQVTDLQITAEIKSKLATDVGVSSVTDIAVNTTKGVVTLTGIVDSPDVKSKAESVAGAVPNVARVVDNIQVSDH